MAKKKNSRRIKVNGWYDNVLWEGDFRDTLFYWKGGIGIDLGCDQMLTNVGAYPCAGQPIKIRIYRENRNIYIDSNSPRPPSDHGLRIITQKMSGTQIGNRQKIKLITKLPMKLTKVSRKKVPMGSTVDFSLDEIQQAQELIKLMGKGL